MVEGIAGSSSSINQCNLTHVSTSTDEPLSGITICSISVLNQVISRAFNCAPGFWIYWLHDGIVNDHVNTWYWSVDVKIKVFSFHHFLRDGEHSIHHIPTF